MGLDAGELRGIVAGLAMQDFYKSMATHGSSRIWQDVYRTVGLTLTSLKTIVISVPILFWGIIMQTIQASEFKSRCLALMDDVARSGEVLVVTKNGRPVAELRPYSGGKCGSPFGLHSGLEITGDILSPIEEDAWKVLE